MNVKGLRTLSILAISTIPALLFGSCGSPGGKATAADDMPAHETGKPVRAEMEGYEGDIMEPFISRDGKYLFFNGLNDGDDTCLYWAVKITETKFRFMGKVEGANGAPPHLDAVASMDAQNRFYFISTRDYPAVFENVQAGVFEEGAVSGVKPVEGNFYIREPGNIVMDAEISPDGETLYICYAYFTGGPVPEKCDIHIAVRNGKTGRFELAENSREIMKDINAESAIQYAPSISPDGLELYFTRLESNAALPEICVARRKSAGAPFQNPEPTGIQGFAEAVTICGEGELIYFHKKDGPRYALYMQRVR